jgi:hypothetical protein
MPRFTEHYGLGIKLANEPFLASIDRSRMSIIANQLAFLADLVGDGRIEGWHLTSPEINKVRVSGGTGIIDRFTTSTFGPLDLVFPSAGTYYLFARRKLGVIGGFSNFSTRVGHAHSDLVPPAAPDTIIVGVRTRSSIQLSWVANTEIDIDKYRVYRSTDNTVSGWAAVTEPVLETVLPTCIDTNLVDETTYFYRISAVDKTGNEGVYTSVTSTTLQDLRTPSDPRSVKVLQGNKVLQVTWLSSLDDFVHHYEITYQELGAGGVPVGVPTIATALSGITYFTISSLVNNTEYSVTVKSVSKNNIKSSGITTVGVPVFNSGPKEISALTLSQSFTNSTVKITVQWTPGTGSGTAPFRYWITLIENESKESQPIVVLTGTTATISTFQSSINGSLVGNSIKEATRYTVRVRGESSTGVFNVGVVGAITINRFTPPAAPTSPEVILFNNRFLRLSWQNSTSPFKQNLISLNKTDLSSMTTTSLLTNVNVGRSQTFLFDSENVDINFSYDLTVVAVDTSGNNSADATANFTTGLSVPLPPLPRPLLASANIGSIELRWSPANIDNADKYKVYRANMQARLSATAFVLLDTLEADQTQFIDYDVQNQFYAYVVTTVDTYGNESAGPGTGQTSTGLVLSKPTVNNFLSTPTSVQLTVNGDDIDLSWLSDSDFYDGYQVYRSIGNLHSWELIGDTDRAVPFFKDSDVLVKGGVSYHYMIRKYRNEADMIFDESSALPSNSIILGKIVFTGSAISVMDETLAVEIKSIQDPILEETAKRLATHKHIFVSDSDDRRINLSSDWAVIDWKSTNRITYSTTQNISDTNSETVYVNDSPTSLFYDIDRDLGTITFENRLARNSVVKVIFHDVEETQGVLPSEKVGSVNATNFDSGTVREEVLPPIDHIGRMEDRLVPVQEDLQNIDLVRYKMKTHTGNIGVAFYDIVGTDTTGTIVAATNLGIMQSLDFGHTWSLIVETNFPVHKLFKATVTGLYFALSANQVLVSTTLLTNWTIYEGMEHNIQFVYDVTEDPAGYVFVSTDQGVYYLNPTLTEKRWEQRTIVDYKSTGCYGLYYSSVLLGIVVSTEVGLFYTTNRGATWTLWSAFTEQKIIYQFIKSGISLFALSDTVLYRKNDADTLFSRMATWDSAARKMTIFRTRIYLATDKEIITSDGDFNSLTTILFRNILPQLGKRDRKYAILSLNVISDRLFLGMDQRLYSSGAHGYVTLQYQELYSVAPAIFVDGKERNVGVFYNRDWVLFDQRQEPTAKITIANQFSTYKAVSGGWADIDYLAPVTVYADGKPINDPDFTQPETEHSLSTLVLPDISSRNSTFEKASPIAEDITARLDTIDLSFTRQNIVDFLGEIARLRASIDESLSLIIPPISSELFLEEDGDAVATVDAVNGTFNFAISNIIAPGLPNPFWKYSQLSVNVEGISLSNEGDFTHEDLDDLFEKKLSGLPASMAQLEQVNQVTDDILIEKIWPGDRIGKSEPLQTEVFYNCSLNWYDTFNSTVDFKLRVRQANLNIALQYPSSVMVVASRNEVWVSGLSGIIAINITTLAVTKVLGLGNQDFVREMLLDGSVVHAVTTDSLFTITISDLSYVKNDGIGIPTGLNSIVKASGDQILGTTDGVYLRKADDIWEKVLGGANIRVVNLGDLLLAYDDTGKIYSSPSGNGWTSKGTLGDIENGLISKVLKFGTVFFASTVGLYEDNSTFYSKDIRLRLVNLTGNTASSKLLNINDITATGSTFLVGLSNGKYYSYENNTFILYDESASLETIHKIAIVNGDKWLFGFDKLKVVSSGSIVKLATGNRLSWQQ